MVGEIVIIYRRRMSCKSPYPSHSTVCHCAVDLEFLMAKGPELLMNVSNCIYSAIMVIIGVRIQEVEVV